MSGAMCTLLLIDDDRDDYLLTREYLDSARAGKFKLEWANSVQAGWDQLSAGIFDAVLVDYHIADQAGIDFIRQANRAGYHEMPFILVTGQGSLQIDIQAMQAGAVDYLSKDELTPALLERSIRYAIDRKRNIIDLLKANQALEQERARLQTVVDNAPSGILLTDQAGQFLLSNPAANAFFGGEVSGDASSPSGGYQLLHADGTPFQPEELPLVRALHQGETTRNQNITIRLANGQADRVILTNSGPIYGTEGQIAGSVAIMTDITEQRRTLDALRESEERFRLATRAVNAVVYDWDLQSNQIFRSDGLRQVIGVRPTEITQEHGWWEQRVHPDDYPLLEKTINEKIHGDADSYDIEYRVQHLMGHWIDVWERAFIIRDEHGKAFRVVGTRNDITDRKRAEKNARFLADLGEKLLILEEPEAMFSYATQAIANHLEVDRCVIDEIDQAAQTVTVCADYHGQYPSISGTYPFSPLNRTMASRMVKGHIMVIEDTAQDPDTAPLYESFLRYGVRTFMAIPRINENGWAGTITVSSAQPHLWRDDEMALLKQSSDLIWLAVQTARLYRQVREAQNRLEVALSNSRITVYTTDCDRRYTWVYNSELEADGESIVGKREDELVDPEAMHEIIQAKQSVLDTGVGIRREFVVNYQKRMVYIDMTIEPLRGPNGEVEGLIVAASNTTQMREMQEQAQETAQRLAIQRQISRQREEERQQIARDLHDGPIQNLLGLVFALQSALSLTDNPELTHELLSIQDETRNLISELRALCNELRPPALMQFGLAKAIRSHADAFQERHPELKIDLDLEDQGQPIDDSASLALYRIFQETLNNIARHALASAVWIKLVLTESDILLEIQDNGTGFQPPKDYVTLAHQGHLGLVGMRERAEAIGGTLTILSQPGKGTQVVLQVPRAEMLVSG